MPSSEFKVNLKYFEENIAEQILEELDPDQFELDLSGLQLKVDYDVRVEIKSVKVVNAEREYDVNNEKPS